ncbi:MAG: hypothetical protein MI922_19515 [Bacteroidales bacterium]|nr:hypothetical protein [Bacteroidales bacterium]
MKVQTNIALGILLCFLLFACKYENSITYDKVNVKLTRFDKELFSQDIYSISDSLNYFHKKHPEFFSLYTNRIIEVGDITQEGFPLRFKLFFTNKTIYQAQKRVSEVYKDISDIELQLSDALGIFNYYFSDRYLPKLYTHVSGFNQSIVTSDNIISVSLDKYLGKEEAFYNMMYPPIPAYLRQNMIRQRIPIDIVYALGTMEFPFQPQKKDLLSHMIYEGMLKHFTKTLFPNENDTLIWGYTPAQLEFCQKNEESMWVYLVEQKLLFETDEFSINKYINDAPFTKDFTKESPGKAVTYVGYQIVQSYLKRNEDLSLAELMEETNYHQIMNEARYNP